MSRMNRMQTFLRDLNYTKSGQTTGVRVRYARPWQAVSVPLAEYVIEIGTPLMVKKELGNKKCLSVYTKQVD